MRPFLFKTTFLFVFSFFWMSSAFALHELGIVDFNQSFAPNSRLVGTVSFTNPNTTPFSMDAGDKIVITVPDSFDLPNSFYVSLRFSTTSEFSQTPSYDKANRTITQTLSGTETIAPNEVVHLSFFYTPASSIQVPSLPGEYFVSIHLETDQGVLKKTGLLRVPVQNTVDVTASVAPASPTNLSAVSLGSGDVDLDWDDSIQAGIDGFTVYYKKSTEATYPDWFSNGSTCPTLEPSTLFPPLKGCHVIYGNPPSPSAASIKGLIGDSYDFLVRSLVSSIPSESDFATCPSCQQNNFVVLNTNIITENPVNMSTDPTVTNGKFTTQTTFYEDLSTNLSFTVFQNTTVRTDQGALCFSLLMPPISKSQAEVPEINRSQKGFLAGVELPGCQGANGTTFDTPVTLTIPITFPAGVDPNTIQVEWYNPRTANYEVLGGTVSPDGKYIRVQVSHMSTFIVTSTSPLLLTKNNGSAPTFQSPFANLPFRDAYTLPFTKTNEVLQLNRALNVSPRNGLITQPVRLFHPGEYHLSALFALGTQITAPTDENPAFPYSGFLTEPQEVSSPTPKAGYQLLRAVEFGSPTDTIYTSVPWSLTIPILLSESLSQHDIEVFEWNPETQQYSRLSDVVFLPGPQGKTLVSVSHDRVLKDGYFALFVRQTVDTHHSYFPDVDDREWFASYVHELVDLGVIQGYPDGTFGPDTPVNNAEMVKILSHLFGLEIPTQVSEPPFIDVPVDQWYTPYVLSTKKAGVLEGSFGDFFDPARFTTRYEILRMTLLAAGVDMKTISRTQGDVPFDDIAPGSPLAPVIKIAFDAGIIQGYDDGTFRPRALVNRAELAKILILAREKVLDNTLPANTHYPSF